MKYSLISLMLAIFVITGCGNQGGSSLKGIGSQSDSNPVSTVPVNPIPGTTYIPFSPGSYFKVIKEVGSNKDTRVIEFQYLSSGKFILTQTSFMGGNLTRGYFHKKIGTYSEKLGSFTHDISYDSCNDLSRILTFASGNRNTAININWKGSLITFYSYATRTLPSDISSNIIDAVEDVGCKVFKS